MVDRTVKFHSERTSHDPAELLQVLADSKIQDLTPYACDGRQVSLTLRAGKRLFGSVTNIDIERALREQDAHRKSLGHS